MSRVASFFISVFFPAVIVGVEFIVRRYPVLATAMALGPAVVTWASAVVAVIHGTKEYRREGG
jgi:hypothetical protein